MKRDVIIVNFVLGGGGDHALGDKTKELVLSVGASGVHMTCQGGIRNISILKKLTFGKQIINYSNPLIIVTPYNLISPEDLPAILRQVMASYHCQSDTLIMIDEMDMNRDFNAGESDYREALSILKFKSVIIRDLGFTEHSIGYFPMDKDEVIRISKKSKNEIIKCLDGYNMSLPDQCDLYLAYLSSSSVVKSAYTFTINTLIEDATRNKNAVYLLVVRQDSQVHHFIEQLKKLLLSEKYTHLFSRCEFSSSIDNGYLNLIGAIPGRGEKRIHICMTKSIPMTMFKNFTHRSRAGMMSGDQSLSDYLSLKHKLPYYDKQPWKDPLAEGLFRQAKEVGGIALLEKIESLVVGPNGRESGIMARLLDPGYIKTPDQKESLKRFNHELYLKQADKKIKELLLQCL